MYGDKRNHVTVEFLTKERKHITTRHIYIAKRK